MPAQPINRARPMRCCWCLVGAGANLGGVLAMKRHSMTDQPIPYTVSELAEFTIYLDLCTTFRAYELVRVEDEMIIISLDESGQVERLAVN